VGRLFESGIEKTIKLKNKIGATDKEIDTMVFELYRLSDAEIGTLENS
jgi:hypothetical protein